MRLALLLEAVNTGEAVGNAGRVAVSDDGVSVGVRVTVGTAVGVAVTCTAVRVTERVPVMCRSVAVAVAELETVHVSGAGAVGVSVSGRVAVGSTRAVYVIPRMRSIVCVRVSTSEAVWDGEGPWEWVTVGLTSAVPVAVLEKEVKEPEREGAGDLDGLGVGEWEGEGGAELEAVRGPLAVRVEERVREGCGTRDAVGGEGVQVREWVTAAVAERDTPGPADALAVTGCVAVPEAVRVPPRVGVPLRRAVGVQESVAVEGVAAVGVCERRALRVAELVRDRLPSVGRNVGVCERVLREMVNEDVGRGVAVAVGVTECDEVRLWKGLREIEGWWVALNVAKAVRELEHEAVWVARGRHVAEAVVEAEVVPPELAVTVAVRTGVGLDSVFVCDADVVDVGVAERVWVGLGLGVPLWEREAVWDKERVKVTVPVAFAVAVSVGVCVAESRGVRVERERVTVASRVGGEAVHVPVWDRLWVWDPVGLKVRVGRRVAVSDCEGARLREGGEAVMEGVGLDRVALKVAEVAVAVGDGGDEEGLALGLAVRVLERVCVREREALGLSVPLVVRDRVDAVGVARAVAESVTEGVAEADSVGVSGTDRVHVGEGAVGLWRLVPVWVRVGLRVTAGLRLPVTVSVAVPELDVDRDGAVCVREREVVVEGAWEGVREAEGEGEGVTVKGRVGGGVAVVVREAEAVGLPVRLQVRPGEAVGLAETEPGLQEALRGGVLVGVRVAETEPVEQDRDAVPWDRDTDEGEGGAGVAVAVEPRVRLWDCVREGAEALRLAEGVGLCVLRVRDGDWEQEEGVADRVHVVWEQVADGEAGLKVRGAVAVTEREADAEAEGGVAVALTEQEGLQVPVCVRTTVGERGLRVGVGVREGLRSAEAVPLGEAVAPGDAVALGVEDWDVVALADHDAVNVLWDALGLGVLVAVAEAVALTLALGVGELEGVPVERLGVGTLHVPLGLGLGLALGVGTLQVVVGGTVGGRLSDEESVGDGAVGDAEAIAVGVAERVPRPEGVGERDWLKVPEGPVAECDMETERLLDCVAEGAVLKVGLGLRDDEMEAVGEPDPEQVAVWELGLRVHVTVCVRVAVRLQEPVQEPVRLGLMVGVGVAEGLGRASTVAELVAVRVTDVLRDTGADRVWLRDPLAEGVGGLALRLMVAGSVVDGVGVGADRDGLGEWVVEGVRCGVHERVAVAGEDRVMVADDGEGLGVRVLVAVMDGESVAGEGVGVGAAEWEKLSVRVWVEGEGVGPLALWEGEQEGVSVTVAVGERPREQECVGVLGSVRETVGGHVGGEPLEVLLGECTGEREGVRVVVVVAVGGTVTCRVAVAVPEAEAVSDTERDSEQDAVPVAVHVGTWERLQVLVGVGLRVWEGAGDSEADVEAEGLGERERVAGEGEGVPEREVVVVARGVAVAEESVSVGVGVGVGVGLCVSLGRGVGLREGDAVEDREKVTVGVGVVEPVAEREGVCVRLRDSVPVLECDVVYRGVRVQVLEALALTEMEAEGVAVVRESEREWVVEADGLVAVRAMVELGLGVCEGVWEPDSDGEAVEVTVRDLVGGERVVETVSVTVREVDGDPPERVRVVAEGEGPDGVGLWVAVGRGEAVQVALRLRVMVWGRVMLAVRVMEAERVLETL